MLQSYYTIIEGALFMNLEILSPTTASGAMFIGVLFSLIYAIYIKKKESTSWLYFFLAFSAGGFASGCAVILLKSMEIIN